MNEDYRGGTIFFEAHATSFDNELGIASGHRDPPLTSLGRAQAIELGQRYRNIELSVVCCSDLVRSNSTAEIAFADRLHLIRVDPRLRECDYGTFAGRPQTEIAANRERFVIDSYPEGESYTQVVERIRLFLSGLWREIPRGHPALIIGHRATQYGLECVLNERELAEVVCERWAWQPGWIYVRGDKQLQAY